MFFHWENNILWNATLEFLYSSNSDQMREEKEEIINIKLQLVI